MAIYLIGAVTLTALFIASVLALEISRTNRALDASRGETPEDIPAPIEPKPIIIPVTIYSDIGNL